MNKKNSTPLQRRQHVRPFIVGAEFRSKRWLEIDGRFAIGDGGIELLKEVGDVGSLATAAMNIGWSYRRAWGYLRRAEKVLGQPIVLTRSGKGKRRGSSLTPFALKLVRAFQRE